MKYRFLFLLAMLLSMNTILFGQDRLVVPLTQGYENPMIKYGNFTVHIERFYSQEKPYFDRSVTAFLALKIEGGETAYSTHLNYWDENRSGLKENYPLAVGPYIFSLLINDEGDRIEAALTVEKNDFGRAFFLPLNQETIVGELTVRYDFSVVEKRSHGPKKPFFDVGVAWIKLSEGSDEKKICFDTEQLFEEKQLVFDWMDYRIRVLGDHDRLVELMVEKNGDPAGL